MAPRHLCGTSRFGVRRHKEPCTLCKLRHQNLPQAACPSDFAIKILQQTTLMDMNFCTLRLRAGSFAYGCGSEGSSEVGIAVAIGGGREGRPSRVTPRRSPGSSSGGTPDAGLMGSAPARCHQPLQLNPVPHRMHHRVFEHLFDIVVLSPAGLVDRRSQF